MKTPAISFLLVITVSLLCIDHVASSKRGGASHATALRQDARLSQCKKRPRIEARGKTKNSNTDRTYSSRARVSRGGGGADVSAQSSSLTLSPSLLNAIRLLYLTYYASLGALLPYLPVYFHSLGHTGSAIGILGAVKPLTTFIVAPVWGLISDRSGNHLSVLQFTFVTSLIFQLVVGMQSGLNYLIATVFAAALFNAPVKSLIDSMVMGKLTTDEDRRQFGRVRLWGQIGFGVGSSFVGTLLSRYPSTPPSPSGETPDSSPTISAIKVGIEVASETDAAAETAALLTNKARLVFYEMTRELLGKTRPLRGYELAFLVYGILSIPAFLCIRAFKPERSETDDVDKRAVNTKKHDDVERKGTDIFQGLKLLLHNSDALIFFFLVFVIGTSSGCVENFAYVRIREVGGTGHQMGMCRLVSSLAGAPMFWFSGPLTEALGVDRILVLSLLAYAARFFNYAWMKHPYHCLPAEALRGLTFAAFWTSGSMYAHRISPPGMNATMLMLLNAMYGGLGQSLGAIIGGKLQSTLGTIKMFEYSGIFDLCFVGILVSYFLSKKERAFR